MDTFDPKENYVGKSLNFNDIVVYVVGGGCYTEYQDVVSLINVSFFVKEKKLIW